MKEREKECISFHVDASTYWRIRHMAEDKGMNISQFMCAVVSNHITDKIVEDEGTKTKRASDKQKKYIADLCNKTHQPKPKTIDSMDYFEANETIRNLLELIEQDER